MLYQLTNWSIQQKKIEFLAKIIDLEAKAFICLERLCIFIEWFA